MFSGPTHVYDVDVPLLRSAATTTRHQEEKEEGTPCALIDPVDDAVTVVVAPTPGVDGGGSHSNTNGRGNNMIFRYVRVRLNFQPQHVLARRVLGVCRRLLPAQLFRALQKAVVGCRRSTVSGNGNAGGAEEEEEDIDAEWKALVRFFRDHLAVAAGVAVNLSLIHI